MLFFIFIFSLPPPLPIFVLSLSLCLSLILSLCDVSLTPSPHPRSVIKNTRSMRRFAAQRRTLQSKGDTQSWSDFEGEVKIPASLTHHDPHGGLSVLPLPPPPNSVPHTIKEESKKERKRGRESDVFLFMPGL